MRRYYTRVCNFYYGKESEILVSKKKTLPLNNNKKISFDHIEIISRQSKKKKESDDFLRNSFLTAASSQLQVYYSDSRHYFFTT